MNKENIFIEIYNSAIDKSIECGEDSIKLVFNFIVDRSAYDYYCNTCNKVKTYIQNQNKSIIINCTYDRYEAINMYSPELNENTINYTKNDYTYSDKLKMNIYETNSKFFIFKYFQCPTCNEKLTMIFLFENNSITKIYQSFISDIIEDDDIQAFKKMKLLSEDDLMELNNANKCKKLGMNVASFVYMRRIFENMLQRIYEDHKREITLKDTSKKFTDLYVKDKIKLLKPHLPILMNEETTSDKYVKLYKLLSEGIHKLNEDVCEGLYNIINELLLMILEKEMQEKKNEENLEDLEKNFNKIFNPDLK